MKVRFFTMVTVLVLIIVGFVVFITVNKDNIPEDNTTNTEITTPVPTQVPLPSVTPTPVVGAEADPGLYPAYQVIDGVKIYGYINSAGEYVIKPAFDMANDFHDGYAVVYMDNQYLLIDNSGNIIYNSDDIIKDFHNGAAVVARYGGENALYGYVDSQGKEFIKAQYKYAGNFSSDNTAYVYNGKGKYSKIDKTGKVLESYEINAKYNPIAIEDGYIIHYDLKSGNYGVVNLKDEVVFKSKYVEILYMGDNIFALKKSNDDFFGMTNAMPAALFKADGTQLTDYALYDINSFHNGYASTTDSERTYFIGTDGKEAADLPNFDGRGTVVWYSDILKAEIDRDLIYYKKDGSILWQNDTTQKLSDTISAKQIKYKSNKYVTVYYPEIQGLTDSGVQGKINSSLKKLFINSRTGLKEKDMLSVEDSFKATLLKNLLIIEKNGYDYNFGAAHGNPIMDFYYIDITTGTFYQFKDLFIEGSDYTSAINNNITSQLTALSSQEGSLYYANSFTSITDKPYFKLSANALTIYFYPYDIAPYAAGFPEFAIPFADLGDYINRDGDFWRSFNE